MEYSGFIQSYLDFIKNLQGKEMARNFPPVFDKMFNLGNTFSFNKLYKFTSKHCSHFCGYWVESLVYKFSYHAYNKILIKLLLL